jgi:vancomycin resistance protein YoaR
MPLVSQEPQIVRPYSVPDFAAGAKTYRRSQLKGKAIKIAIIFGISILLLILALGVIGYVLNQRYAGRALPYTYVGDISIGGLTQPEIKAVLDKRASEIRVTLKEGGLTREVPVNTFGANFDTQKASESAITGFNPFGYLTKRSFVVPVEINENYVDGYIRLNVANMQTDAENATIVKSKKELVIVPETIGFRTSSAYVAEQLKEQLPSLDDPVINLSTATDRPAITQADLQDDIETAQKLIATKAGVKVYNTIITPTEEQKLSWLEIKEVPNSTEVQIQFSQSKVREYIFELAKKYTTDPENEQLVTNPDGTKTVQPGKKGTQISNIDEVATSLFRALSGQQAQVIAFTMSATDYQKVDPSLVSLQPTALTTPDVDDAGQNPVALTATN